MDNKNKKIEPWRIIVALLSAAYIIYMWIRKDIAAIYATMPEEQILPMVVTTVAVSLLKVAAAAGAILLLRWIIKHFGSKR